MRLHLQNKKTKTKEDRAEPRLRTKNETTESQGETAEREKQKGNAKKIGLRMKDARHKLQRES